jgi:hypothetical protein
MSRGELLVVGAVSTDSPRMLAHPEHVTHLRWTGELMTQVDDV